MVLQRNAYRNIKNHSSRWEHQFYTLLRDNTSSLEITLKSYLCVGLLDLHVSVCCKPSLAFPREEKTFKIPLQPRCTILVIL